MQKYMVTKISKCFAGFSFCPRMESHSTNCNHSYENKIKFCPLLLQFHFSDFSRKLSLFP